MDFASTEDRRLSSEIVHTGVFTSVAGLNFPDRENFTMSIVLCNPDIKIHCLFSTSHQQTSVNYNSHIIEEACFHIPTNTDAGSGSLLHTIIFNRMVNGA